eukprot:TRINITY_DN6726_c0_g4_i2.p1 TRINITY_DN6726_c0_g4~~TRINITY_DN6726_c0_g4_i2.p1  ORF type:complete len:481 (+),score=72.48 TRINITY_DN6726_c0_g4_i2:52-1494(+)
MDCNNKGLLKLPATELEKILLFLSPQALGRVAQTCSHLKTLVAKSHDAWNRLYKMSKHSYPKLSEKDESYIQDWRSFLSFYSKEKTTNWEFSQMFGEDESDDEGDFGEETSTDNWISSLAFDSTGDFLAVGYNCGQVVVLKQQDEDNTYQLYTEFKSHDSEFDFLTSMEIEEKINMIRWYPFSSHTPLMMTCNDKTVKLFKMFEKITTRDGEKKSEVQVVNKLTYEGAHSYNINSISFNSDGETWISSDDLRINLWNINIAKEAFSVVDIKPENMDDLSEVITSSCFHPQLCNILIYGTSKGSLRLGDLRDHALCSKYAKIYEETDNDIGGFFQELVTTISDVKFSKDGRFICARDYLTMKVWDLRSEKKPVKTIKFNEHLVSKLCDLYESDSIFDKFECCWNQNSLQLLTGSYNNNVYICDVFGDTPEIKVLSAVKPGHSLNTEYTLDSSQKVLHVDWHPKTSLVALGAKDFGYLYQKK